jgi:SNF family Na+-dependent transporter
MNQEAARILVPFLFGVFGFIMAFALRKGVNFLIFGVFLYAAFKALEGLNFTPDWKEFHTLTKIIQSLGHSMLSLSANTLNTANTASIILFLAGGIVGLATFSRSGA